MQGIQELQLQSWELYRDVHGMKPRWVDFNEPYWQTLDNLSQRIKDLEEDLKIQMEDEAKGQAEAIERFEAKVNELVAAGAKDDATAVQWLMDAEEPDREWQDKELFCYNWGLPYNYLECQP